MLNKSIDIPIYLYIDFIANLELYSDISIIYIWGKLALLRFIDIIDKFQSRFSLGRSHLLNYCKSVTLKKWFTLKIHLNFLFNIYTPDMLTPDAGVFIDYFWTPDNYAGLSGTSAGSCERVIKHKMTWTRGHGLSWVSPKKKLKKTPGKDVE